MRNLLLIILIQSLLSLSAGAENTTPDEMDIALKKMDKERNGSCNYPILDKIKKNEELMCELNVLKKRCNKVDDCFYYCFSQDIQSVFFDGCGHLCLNYSGHKWIPPKGLDACEKK